jgi:zinc/manganese transport system permease protein
MLSAEMLEIVGPAFVAGLMIAATHAPLGLEVLKRGIIFIDLAIAQVAGLGIVIASGFADTPPPWLVQSAALTCAVLAALFFRLVERHLPKQQEAIIGCSFVFAASLALLLLADHPHGGEEIQHLLSGQILFVTWQDVLVHAPIYAAILTLWFVKLGIRQGIAFYLVFAAAITSSVQLVGVYVVFASLILPALAAEDYSRKQCVAWLCGAIAVTGGIAFSISTDLATGPVLVCSYILCSVLIVGVGWARNK